MLSEPWRGPDPNSDCVLALLQMYNHFSIIVWRTKVLQTVCGNGMKIQVHFAAKTFELCGVSLMIF